MPAAGDTFRSDSPGAHLFIVLTTPRGADNRFVIVNLTTKKDYRGEDHSCVLVAGEHPFVIHDTIVLYRTANITDEAAFRGLSSQGSILHSEVMSRDLLRKIQDGALVSRFTPNKVKTAVSEELGPL